MKGEEEEEEDTPANQLHRNSNVTLSFTQQIGTPDERGGREGGGRRGGGEMGNVTIEVLT